MSSQQRSDSTRLSRRAVMVGGIAIGASIAGGGQLPPISAAEATPPAPDVPDAMPAMEFPDTAIGQEFASLIEAVNSRDPDTFLTHFETYFPPEIAEGMAVRTYVNSAPLGTLVLHRIDELTETRVTALVEATLSEEWLSVTLLHDEEGRSDIELRPAAPEEDTGLAGPLGDEAIAAEMSRYLGKLAAAEVFSGAVLIARKGEPIFLDAYGLANVERGEVNTVQTRFNLGSMNKMFTATAIARLVESGEMAFTDHLSTYLPDYPAEVADKVTIHHLLTHTSGLGDFFGPRYEDELDSLNTLSDYLPLFVDQPLRFEPGERHEYSNAGFIVLGLVIEAVSGQDYFDHVREQVYAPAGMAATDSFERDRSVPNLATGYTYRMPQDPAELTFAVVRGGREPNTFFLSPRGTSAGGGYSTVEDLLLFDRALRSNGLVSPSMAETLMEGKVDTPVPGVRYGYGFVDDRAGAERVVGHSGGAPGINGNLEMFQESDVTLVVLANVDRAAQLIMTKAKRLLQER